ncbi:MAG: polysaccharide lyase [Nannocystaceae bacterium]|nr:polysaccharide lyase [bacterium]
MRPARFAAVLFGLASLALPTIARAEPVWFGDFETADLSQWNFLLNPTIEGNDYITIEETEVAQGSYAARVELHNDAEWGNGLKRVELQHRPEDARTAEGATTFFAWSVFLPEELPVEPSQQIGYWESNGSFQQMMAFQAEGTTLTFVTRRPDNVVQWEGKGVLTAGQWHRIAMSVTWSTNADSGLVNLWFDGEQVVTDGVAQTLADGNPHFVQIGLLRGQIEFDDVPVILLDHALEGDSLEDVEYDALPGGEGGSTGGDSTGGEPTTGDEPGPTTGDMPDPTGDPSTTGTTSSTGGDAASTNPSGTAGSPDADTDTDTDTAGASSGGGGCTVGGAPGVCVLLGLAGLFRRRRS